MAKDESEFQKRIDSCRNGAKPLKTNEWARKINKHSYKRIIKRVNILSEEVLAPGLNLAITP